jgi:putative ABC transport system ATP-binding protein
MQTQALTYRYASGPALMFPDVDVAQGAVLLLTGPSGCGKSTWVPRITSLQTPGAPATLAFCSKSR